MSYDVWLSFLSYALVTALSPGPNNILALNATSNYGFRQSRNLLSGIYLGFLAIQLLCIISSSFLVALLPELLPYMKYVGAAYICWLAWHVAVSKPMSVTGPDTTMLSFVKGFVLQFANVKIILWGLTAFTAYVLPYYSAPLTLLGFTLLATLIGNGATLLWAVVGAAFSSLLQRHWRTANLAMALLLAYSAASLLW